MLKKYCSTMSHEDKDAWARDAQARIAELDAALRDIFTARPCGDECSDFTHSPSDHHRGTDCTCVERWDKAVAHAMHALIG